MNADPRVRVCFSMINGRSSEPERGGADSSASPKSTGRTKQSRRFGFGMARSLVNGGRGRLRHGHVPHLSRGAHGQTRGQNQQARQSAVFAAEALEVGHGFQAQSLCHQRVRGHVFELKQVGGTEGLMFGDKQLALAAQVGTQRRIKDEAPENVPVARLAVHGVLVDHQVVIILRLSRSAILSAGYYYIEVQALVGRLVITQSLAQVPWPDAGQLARARNFRTEDKVVAIVIDGERLDRRTHGSGGGKSRGDKSDRGGRTNVVAQHSDGDYVNSPGRRQDAKVACRDAKVNRRA